jgi:AraC-like DNA-binding protein
MMQGEAPPSEPLLLPPRVVAAKSGFRDARYLCDVFARKLKMTPGQYREETRRAPREFPRDAQ